MDKLKGKLLHCLSCNQTQIIDFRDDCCQICGSQDLTEEIPQTEDEDGFREISLFCLTEQEKQLPIKQIASRLDAYYDKAMSLERGDIDMIDIAKMKLEITMMQSRLHEIRADINTPLFVKYNNLCKHVIVVLNQHQNDAIQYYKAIRNSYREEFGIEAYGRIVKGVKSELGRN